MGYNMLPLKDLSVYFILGIDITSTMNFNDIVILSKYLIMIVIVVLIPSLLLINDFYCHFDTISTTLCYLRYLSIILHNVLCQRTVICGDIYLSVV